MSEMWVQCFTCCVAEQPQTKRRRLDRSMIGNPTNFRHTAHVGSGEMSTHGADRVGWEYQNVSLTRVPGYGFGIAVSGGRDNPHFINGDPAIAISDVLKAGPAEGKLQVNDRVVSANGISLENVDYNTAVQVLRECGNSVNLTIKRRVLVQPNNNNDLVKVTLTKSKKKEDFGIVLGCRIFIKEITNRSLIDNDTSLQEGDIVVKINNTSTENLSIKEAKKLIESSKEKLNLVVKREANSLNSRNNENSNSMNQPRWSSSNLYDNAPISAIKESSYDAINGPRSNWNNQNVYVQPPTRSDFARQNDDKNNLARVQQNQGGPSGRNRGPILDTTISLSQLDQPATPLLTGHSRGPSLPLDEPPPRPPPPRPSMRSEEDSLRRKQPPPLNLTSEPRFISFQKEGSVGIRLTGGNEVGIFVTAVQPGSPASLQGLQPGDKILKANNTDFRDVTREEAVLFLLSIQDKIDLIVQHRRDEYDNIIANQKGDSFYIRVHFNYENPNKGELAFHVGEVFHVIDTLYNGVVGSWLVYRIGRNNQEIQKGAIPNKAKADELAAEQSVQRSKKLENSESRGSFFKRRSARRSKSLSKDHWEDVVFADGLSKFSAYEKVSLKHPGFIRPVVLFGPLADVAREKLLKDFSDKYDSPQVDTNDELPKSHKTSSIVRLSAIKEIIDKGKHALLDITPNAVDRLNYAQFYPIVIFMRADNKSIVKELRSRLPKPAHTAQCSSRKLYEHGVKLEKLWNHVFTATITLTNADMWYKKLRETIEKQQQQNIWTADSKPEETIGDDFLFPMTSRLSYASSPESDLDLPNDPRLDNDENSPRLVKASSDPSIATAEDAPGAVNSFGYPPPYSMRSPNSRQVLPNESKKSLQVSRTKEAAKEAADHEDYFGIPKDVYNSLPPGERYPGDYNIYGNNNGNKQTNGPEPPPRVDRNNKPSRFRSAHERLFGRREHREHREHRDSFSTPDYINTTSSPPASQKCDSLDRPSVPNGRGAFGDSSSYSSDSYNKYGSPSGTLDNKQRYNSLTSANSNYGVRPVHDPYKFTRSTAQPHIMPNMKSPLTPEKGPKIMPPPPNKYAPDPMAMRPAPPSPPPKPSNYQSTRLADGRPIPPPKPSHYQLSKPPWMNDNDAIAENGFNHLQPSMSMIPNGIGYSAVYPQPKRASNSNLGNMELQNGSSSYYSFPSKDQPPNIPAPSIPSRDLQNSYANQTSTFGSPTRSRPPQYSDTESSSGYMTSKSNYDSMRSPYSSAKTSSSRSSLINGNGPYLNVPYPPKHQRQDPPNLTSSFASSPPGPQPPPSLLDLSSNRENRGSAFELYRKPGESLNRSGFHGLPPPPPMVNNGIDHNGRQSTQSLDSNHNVVASAKGIFTNTGGTLTSEETGVSVVIPPGAIPEGVEQEIYFKVCHDTSMLPPLDKNKGETLLSPIVMCGPHGLRFEVPVELRLPHCASLNPESWSFALKSSDTTNGQLAEWQNISLESNDNKNRISTSDSDIKEGIAASKIHNSHVSVLVDHF